MSELEVMLIDRGVTVDILEFAKKQPDTVGGPDVCPPKNCSEFLITTLRLAVNAKTREVAQRWAIRIRVPITLGESAMIIHQPHGLLRTSRDPSQAIKRR
jgi:hypothetical protein